MPKPEHVSGFAFFLRQTRIESERGVPVEYDGSRLAGPRGFLARRSQDELLGGSRIPHKSRKIGIVVTMMFKTKPADFNKRFDIVGCFVQHDGRFLLLRRHPHKASGDKWGLPAGKLEEGEELKQGVLREIEEETGLQTRETSVDLFDSFYVRDGDFDFEWHAFSTELNSLPTVVISPNEHSEFTWATAEEALQMNLIHDLPETIELFYNMPVKRK